MWVWTSSTGPRSAMAVLKKARTAKVARTPAPFQEQCVGGVTAFYELIDDETIRVLNRRDVPGGVATSAG
jgi:hypothetical protein